VVTAAACVGWTSVWSTRRSRGTSVTPKMRRIRWSPETKTVSTVASGMISGESTW
jgi:hypothetical protein